MFGRKPGHVTTHGERLSAHFRHSGYSVISVSASTNRYVRLVDIVSSLIRHRNRIDILIVDVYGERSFIVEDISSWLGKRFNKPVVMVLHGGTLPAFMVRFPRWTNRVLSRADALITPSDYMARSIIRHGFQPRIIPNMIDLSAYPYRHRRELNPSLLWMRSFYPYYNPMMAVRVLASLRSKIPEATLIMAGQDDGMLRDVQKTVRDLGLCDAVRFPGFLDMAGKVREGNAADVFLNTTNIDNMPVAVVEACAMGIPVVSTAAGGIPDLVTNGETGLLVPDDDDRAMVEAVHRLLKDPDLSAHLSANGRRLAERSSWERVRPQWERVFTDVMAPAVKHSYATTSA